MEHNPSNEYLVAIQAHNEAIRTFEPVRDAYRAGKLGSVEFLAARDAYMKACEAYDEAFRIEASKALED